MATIIVVDEEEELRDNLQDLLEFNQYTVIPYSTGEELLANLDSLSMDVVLLDYQLPGVSGIELIPSLKGKNPEIPIAIVTASSSPDTRSKALENGANCVILKPYEPADILQAVKAMLSI
ncbi:MAG: response regulator [Candidatus Omnitrophica bacterium]|nr:response regulator [Candidatus Omnitrophota bacterium]